jgi:hypothetical protein
MASVPSDLHALKRARVGADGDFLVESHGLEQN